MTNTISESIPESEYQDCVEELTVKLKDERKLNSTKNTRIAELEEQCGRQVDFIMAFEKWLDIDAPVHIRYQWQAMKRQHLNSTTEAD
jgi:hypothetical protein